MDSPTTDSLLMAALSHEGALRACLFRYTRNAADVEELLQETYARLLVAGERAVPIKSLRAFCLTVARNVALDWLRHRQVVPIDLVADLEALEPQDPYPPVEEIVNAEQELQRTVAAAQAIPPQARRVFTLKKIYGLSYREIAKKLNISEETVHQHMVIALSRFASALFTLEAGRESSVDRPARRPLRPTKGGNRAMKARTEADFARATDVEAQAAEWVTQIDLRGTPEEWAALDAWLNVSPKHKAAFLRLSMAWRRADTLKRLVPRDLDIDPDLLVVPGERDEPKLRAFAPITDDSGVHRPADRSTPMPAPKFRLFSARTLAAAAMLVLGFIAIPAVKNLLPDGSRYSTAIGEFQRVTLPDGTELAINTNTQVRYRFTNSARSIELKRGEVLVNVAHDATRPLYVTAGTSKVRAVGTEFSVRIREDHAVDILVTEGVVALEQPVTLTLASGSSTSVRGNTITTESLQPEDIDARTAWTSGRLVFMNETLADVVEEMNRYNPRKLIVMDPALSEIRLGGTFSATDPDGFARVLRPLGVRALSTEGESNVIPLVRADDARH